MAATTATLGTMAAVGSASAAGAATAGAAAGGLSAMLTSTMGILSLASTGIGIASSIAGQNMQRGQARQAAYDESLAAKAGRLRGEQEQNRIKRALLRDISTATARGAAAGTGSTLINQQARGIESEGADEISVSRFNTAMDYRRGRAQAAVYRRAGRTSILDHATPIAEGVGRVATYAMAR